MDDETHHSLPQKPSWLERLSHALLREPRDREQLIDLLRDAEQRNLFDAQALAMLEGVLEISEMRVRDITLPRSQMIIIPEAATLNDFLPTVIESAHSRFPVVNEERDEVVGILLAKDLLRFTGPNTQTPFNMREVLRPALFIPESKRLDSLLQEFRRTRNHMAIVVDEYGNTGGLVTIEDILEQIVGDIDDEYDIEEETFIKPLSDTQFTIKALTPIEEFNEFFNANLDYSEFDTVGGLVIKAFGYLPKRGETINIEKFRFKVLQADNRRIHLLRLSLRRKQTK